MFSAFKIKLVYHRWSKKARKRTFFETQFNLGLNKSNWKKLFLNLKVLSIKIKPISKIFLNLRKAFATNFHESFQIWFCKIHMFKTWALRLYKINISNRFNQFVLKLNCRQRKEHEKFIAKKLMAFNQNVFFS